MLTWILVAVFSLFLLALAFFMKKPKGNIPPGPWALPFVGNLLQLGPKIGPRLRDWANEYGSIFSIQLGLEKIIVLDDVKLIKKMFDEPAFSGRPQNEMFLGFSEGSYGIINTEREVWEAQRRFTLRHMRDFGFGKQNYMDNLIIEEVKEVLEWLKVEEGHPISMNRKLNLAVVNSLWCMSSGKRFPQNCPTLNNMLDSNLDAFQKLTETMILLFAPWVRHAAPNLSGWNTLQSTLFDVVSFFKKTVEEHKKTYSQQHIRDFVDHYIQEIEATTDLNSSFYGEVGYKHLQGIVGDLFQAGSITTSTTITWAMLYITHHPRVQAKFQQEIDHIVGKSRLPSLADKASMPYTEAIIYEVLRLSILLPVGVFHRALETKEFHGYTIPKGTWLIGNVFSVHSNKQIWGDPENFRPERFLSEDGKTAVKHEALIPFLTGKRQCLGEAFAKDTIFLFLTSIYQHFSVLPDPHNPNPDFEAMLGFIQTPKPFNVVMKDRFL